CLLLVDGRATPLAVEIDLVPDLDRRDTADRRGGAVSRDESGYEVGVVLVTIGRSVCGAVLASPVRLEIQTSDGLHSSRGAGFDHSIRFTPIEATLARAFD